MTLSHPPSSCLLIYRWRVCTTPSHHFVYISLNRLLLQGPWDQRPLVSIACLVMSYHLLWSWALVVQSYTIWQCRPSTLYMACLFYLFRLQLWTSVSLTSCCPPSRICGQTVGVSSEWLFVADPFQFWVCHMFHGLFFALSNWYVGFFGNSTSQMPAVCLWSFCCMSRFHTHIALCWTLLSPVYVFGVVGDVLTFPNILHGLCYFCSCLWWWVGSVEGWAY